MIKHKLMFMTLLTYPLIIGYFLIAIINKEVPSTQPQKIFICYKQTMKDIQGVWHPIKCPWEGK